MAAISPKGIVPALLCATVSDFTKKLKPLIGHTSWLHIDMLDGTLMAGTTLSVSILPKLPPGVHVNLHLMTRNPRRLLSALRATTFRNIIVHREIPRLAETVGEFQMAGFRVSVAFNPATPLQLPAGIQPQGIQLLGVRPGKQGRPLHASVFHRVTLSKQLWPKLPVTIDGGMNVGTVKRARQAGADSIVVGSAIVRSANPAKSLLNLQRAWRAASSRP